MSNDNNNTAVRGACPPKILLPNSFPMHGLLFNFFELLDVLYFDVVRVVGQQVDGVGHHILGQEREQLVCWHTQGKHYNITSSQKGLMITAVY